MPGGTTTITFKKVKAAEDGWRIAVEYKTRQLPNGETTKVAVAGERSRDASNGPAPSTCDHYAEFDNVAEQILERMEDPFATRAALSAAVMIERAPEMRESDPKAFKKSLDAYKKHLTRLGPGHTLWGYVDEKNDKGQPLTFRNPKHRGRRAPKPGRRRGALSYAPLSAGAEGA